MVAPLIDALARLMGWQFELSVRQTRWFPIPEHTFAKNFYALNMQAICSKTKSFLWFSSGHEGSTHDSLALHEMKFYETLNTAEAKLNTEGLFLVGDSAYP